MLESMLQNKIQYNVNIKIIILKNKISIGNHLTFLIRKNNNYIS